MLESSFFCSGVFVKIYALGNFSTLFNDSQCLSSLWFGGLKFLTGRTLISLTNSSTLFNPDVISLNKELNLTFLLRFFSSLAYSFLRSCELTEEKRFTKSHMRTKSFELSLYLVNEMVLCTFCNMQASSISFDCCIILLISIASFLFMN